MDLGDHGLAEVGLLQANAAGLEQKHRQDRLAALPVAPRERQCGRDLARRHLPHASALERALDRQDQGGPAGELPARDDDAVIRLGHDPLERKPGRFYVVERAKQLAKRTGIEERPGALARPHLDDTPARQEAVAALPGDRVLMALLHHERTSSAACSSRNVTVPGVAPKSLIS